MDTVNKVGFLNRFVNIGQTGEPKKYSLYQDESLTLKNAIKNPIQVIKDLWGNALKGLLNSLQFSLDEVSPRRFLLHSIVGIGSLLVGMLTLPVAAFRFAVLGHICAVQGLIACVKQAVAHLRANKGDMANTLKTALRYATVAILSALVGIINSLPIFILRVGSDSLRLKYCQLLEKLYYNIEHKVPKGLRIFVRTCLGLEQRFYKTIKIEEDKKHAILEEQAFEGLPTLFQEDSTTTGSSLPPPPPYAQPVVPALGSKEDSTTTGSSSMPSYAQPVVLERPVIPAGGLVPKPFPKPTPEEAKVVAPTFLQRAGTFVSQNRVAIAETTAAVLGVAAAGTAVALQPGMVSQVGGYLRPIGSAVAGYGRQALQWGAGLIAGAKLRESLRNVRFFPPFVGE